MAPSKTAKTASPKAPAKAKAPGGKKEKIFHPQSRKAAQLSRAQLRKDKMSGAASKRSKRHSAKLDLYGFFYHALPPEGVITLPDLHEIVRDIWLTRHDVELAEEKAQRRKGRPPSAREQKLEEQKLREGEDYRTGLEVPDLTDAANVALFRTWDQTEVAYVEQLRFVRIAGSMPELKSVSRSGIHPSLKQPDAKPPAEPEMEDVQMQQDDAPEPPSTIMYMDGA